MLYAVYQYTKNRKYERALKLLRSQLDTQPRTKEGGFWHKIIYPLLMWLDGITKVSELTEEIKKLNPLKIKDELITKHGFYEYKVKELLLALAMGLRPAKLYNGTDSAIAGFLFVTGDGEVLCYQRAFRQTFADFLFQNSRLEKGSTEKDKYGYLERENGVYYFKLNLKIGLLKR